MLYTHVVKLTINNEQDLESFISFAPAIHLLSLQVASIFEQLNIVEQEADHSLCFFQIGLHLCGVLSGLPRAQHPRVLQHKHTLVVTAPPDGFW